MVCHHDPRFSQTVLIICAFESALEAIVQDLNEKMAALEANLQKEMGRVQMVQQEMINRSPARPRSPLTVQSASLADLVPLVNHLLKKVDGLESEVNRLKDVVEGAYERTIGEITLKPVDEVSSSRVSNMALLLTWTCPNSPNDPILHARPKSKKGLKRQLTRVLILRCLSLLSRRTFHLENASSVLPEKPCSLNSLKKMATLPLHLDRVFKANRVLCLCEARKAMRILADASPEGASMNTNLMPFKKIQLRHRSQLSEGTDLNASSFRLRLNLPLAVCKSNRTVT
jgi:hypothetical protein